MSTAATKAMNKALEEDKCFPFLPFRMYYDQKGNAAPLNGVQRRTVDVRAHKAFSEYYFAHSTHEWPSTPEKFKKFLDWWYSEYPSSDIQLTMDSWSQLYICDVELDDSIIDKPNNGSSYVARMACKPKDAQGNLKESQFDFITRTYKMWGIEHRRDERKIVMWALSLEGIRDAFDALSQKMRDMVAENDPKAIATTVNGRFARKPAPAQAKVSDFVQPAKAVSRPQLTYKPAKVKPEPAFSYKTPRDCNQWYIRVIKDLVNPVEVELRIVGDRVKVQLTFVEY